MSYSIVSMVAVPGVNGGKFIVDEETGRIIAIVIEIAGCKPLVALANRAAEVAAAEAEERTAKRSEGGGGT